MFTDSEKNSVNISDLYDELSNLFENYKQLTLNIKRVNLEIVKYDSYHPTYDSLEKELNELMSNFTLCANAYNEKHKKFGNPFIAKSTLPDGKEDILPLNLPTTPN